MRWTVTLCGLAASVLTTRPAAAQGTVAWPHSGGTVTIDFVDSRSAKLGGAGSTTSGTINGDTHVILNSNRVTFGPYALKVSDTIIGSQVATTSTAAFSMNVKVFARSPGVLGASQSTFVLLGQNSVTVSTTTTTTSTAPNGSSSKTGSVSVTVDLPGVFDVVKVVVTPDTSLNGSHTLTFPSTACGNFDPNNPTAGVDDNCGQAMVNPVGMLVPDAMPLSIIYEPPGNCSWANLTFTQTVGTQATITNASSTSTNTMVDLGPLSSLSQDPSNTTQVNVSSTSNQSQYSISNSTTYGTQFGLPGSNPGNPLCNTNVPVGDTSATNGPGLGDQFVFVIQPSILYWDSNGLTTSRLSTTGVQGTTNTIGTAYIKTIDPSLPKSMLPTFLQNMSAAQLSSIRSLDAWIPGPTTLGNLHICTLFFPSQTAPPMAGGDACAFLAPPRFAPLGRQCSTFNQSQGTTVGQVTVKDAQQAYTSSVNSTDSIPGPARILMSGAAALFSFATFVPGGTAGGQAFTTFVAANNALNNGQQMTLIDSTTTTVVSTTNVDMAFLNSSSDGFFQSYEVKEQTSDEVDVDMYYDSFYGTIGFNPIADCLSQSTSTAGTAASLPAAPSDKVAAQTGTPLFATLASNIVDFLTTSGAAINGIQKLQASLGSDGTVAFSTPAVMTVPAALPVTSGAPGQGSATLQIQPAGAGAFSCSYAGNGATGSSAAYLLTSCGNGDKAGTAVMATNLSLHIASGVGQTAVSVPIGAAFQTAPPTDYTVPKGAVQGLPPGVTFDPATGIVSGTPLMGGGTLFQSLFYALNSQAQRVAALTVNIRVDQNPVAGCFDGALPLICAANQVSFPDSQPLIETTCCSSPGCCELSVSSTAGAASTATGVNAMLGFESASSWTSSAATLAEESSYVTQGSDGLSIQGQGYMEIDGATFDTTQLPPVTGTMGLDIRVPSAQSNPYWTGAIQLYLSCPSANVNHDFIGEADLTGQPLDQFFTAHYTLPADALAALKGSHADCAFQLDVNVNQTQAPYVVDNLRFL